MNDNIDKRLISVFEFAIDLFERSKFLVLLAEKGADNILCEIFNKNFGYTKEQLKLAEQDKKNTMAHAELYMGLVKGIFMFDENIKKLFIELYPKEAKEILGRDFK